MGKIMTSELTIDILDFYARKHAALKAEGWQAIGYGKEYGERRAKDCYYAEKIIGFEAIPVGNKSDSLSDKYGSVQFTHIYNRPGAKPDLQYLIAPDTRVPNYTTNLGDALELAVKMEMKTLNIPTEHGNAGMQQITDQIISFASEYRETE